MPLASPCSDCQQPVTRCSLLAHSLDNNNIGGYEEENEEGEDEFHVTPEGPAALAAALKQNATLTSLSLDGNGLDDAATKLLQEAAGDRVQLKLGQTSDGKSAAASW